MVDKDESVEDDRIRELFTPVSTERPSRLIAEQIRWRMHQRQLRQGDRLPSERELCTIFGVSRATVREAIRVLEASGLVQTKVGVNGGNFISAPTGERMRDEIVDLLAFSRLTAVDVTEVRQILEVGIMPLVCARATDRDIVELEELCEIGREAWSRNDYSYGLSTQFHVRLAKAAHNGAVELLVESISSATLASLIEAATVGPVPGRSDGDEHVALVDAIRAKDATKATEIMARHLQRTADLIRDGEGRAASRVSKQRVMGPAPRQASWGGGSDKAISGPS
jgi:DNA-binding FadR family transcriptional regulator